MDGIMAIVYPGSCSCLAAVTFGFGSVELRSAERRRSSLPLTSIVGLVHFPSGPDWFLLWRSAKANARCTEGSVPHDDNSTFKCPSPFHLTLAFLNYVDVHRCYR